MIKLQFNPGVRPKTSTEAPNVYFVTLKTTAVTTQLQE